MSALVMGKVEGPVERSDRAAAGSAEAERLPVVESVTFVESPEASQDLRAMAAGLGCAAAVALLTAVMGVSTAFVVWSRMGGH